MNVCKPPWTEATMLRKWAKITPQPCERVIKSNRKQPLRVAAESLKTWTVLSFSHSVFSCWLHRWLINSNSCVFVHLGLDLHNLRTGYRSDHLIMSRHNEPLTWKTLSFTITIWKDGCTQNPQSFLVRSELNPFSDFGVKFQPSLVKCALFHFFLHTFSFWLGLC